MSGHSQSVCHACAEEQAMHQMVGRLAFKPWSGWKLRPEAIGPLATEEV